MAVVLLDYVGLYALSALACLASIPRATSIKHPGTRRGLLGLLGSVVIWSAGYVGYLLAPTIPVKLTFYTVSFVFAFVAVGAWLYFCAAYTGRPPHNAPYRNTALAIFGILVALKLTNPLHHLYYTATWTTKPFPHLAIHHQILYWIVLGLSYALVAVGFFMLFERFEHTGTDSRPLIVLICLTGLPAIATILSSQINTLLPLMYEPPGVALFAVGLLFVYFRRFEAIRLTGESEGPAIFLDAGGQIRDYNQTARIILPALQDSIGKPIESVSPSLADQIAEEGLFSVTETDETRYYSVAAAPFTTGEVSTGQLVTLSDVTEQEAYRQQLEETTEQLEALNRVIRHDIRNDMTVILGWSEQLQEHVSAEGADALDRILQKSNHVVKLTDIARDFVDSVASGESTDLEPIELDTILEEELATVRDSYPDASFRISGELPHVSVRANEMLSSVFRNLFVNAVEHNDKDVPEITISCTETPDRVRIEIADNGPGIPDSEKERVFGKGEKGLDSPGTGVGLYLVHTLTDQFGGEVQVDDNERKGAVFIVELPKAD